MTTQDLIERLKRYPIIVGSGVVLFACFLAYYFRIDMVSDLGTKYDEVYARLMQVEDNLVAGGSLEDHLEVMRDRVIELDARIIRQADLAVNLKYFYQLESETGVGLADLRQNSGRPVEGSVNPVFAGVDYAVILTGNFRQMIAYFDELENGHRLYRLKSFSLQRGREVGRSAVTLALNLEILGWPSGT